MHFSAIRTQRRHPAFSRFKMPCCDIAIVATMAGVILGAVCFESPPSATPHVELPATLVSVSSAHFHFLAVDGSGRLYSWGRSLCGETGHGRCAVVVEPREIVTMRTHGSIAASGGGRNHSFAITSNGSVLTWGKDKFGQLGHGERCDQMEPLPVRVLAGFRVLQVACGMAHTIFLSEDSRVFACGKGGGGRLGNGDSSHSFHHTPTHINPRHFMVHPTAGKESRISFVFAGHAHSGALCKDGAAYVWGHALRGQLGLDLDAASVPLPTYVDALSREVVISAAAGYSTSLFVNDSGDVFSCGTCKWGSHGHGRNVMIKSPQLVAELCGSPVSKVSCGFGHSAALNRDGTLLLWGCNFYGQCAASGDVIDIPVQYGSDGACTEVSCGSWSTAVRFKAGFEPASARPRDGSRVSVMPMGAVAAAKSASIFDDESEDREGNMRHGQMRGMAFQYALLAPPAIPTHSSCAAPAALPPKKYESLFQEEQDVDDL